MPIESYVDPLYPNGLSDILSKYDIQPRVWSDCPTGWLPLVDATLAALKAMGWRGHAGQIKSKFGGLRLYLDDLDAGVEKSVSRPYWDGYYDASRCGPMHTLVAMAESQSVRTCEVCGRFGRMNKTGWLRTLCTRHRRELNRTGLRSHTAVIGTEDTP